MYMLLPFLRLSLVWIIGVLLALKYPISTGVTLGMVGLFSLVYFIIFVVYRFKYGTSQLSFFRLNLVGGLLTMLIAYGNVLLHIGEKRQTHFAKFVTHIEPLEGYYAHIEKVYKSSNNLFSCKATVIHIKNYAGWHNSTGSVHLFFARGTNYIPKKGDRLVVNGTPTVCLFDDHQNAKNIFCSLPKPPFYSHTLKKVGKDFMPCTFLNTKNGAEAIRRWCSTILQEQIKEQQAIGIIETLLFAQKDNLDMALCQAYAHTGTMHVLAVSGLHVGMLLLLIQFICSYLLNRIGCQYFLEFLVLVVLWTYTWLCNFSPPILRAVSMITITKFGVMLQRPSNAYNSLFASAFALLLWNPFFLLSWGFQLSYMATLGIIYLYPRINRLLTIENRFIQKIWNATSLSIAAQVGTIPLILYYFNRFPFYFIIANWLVVPAIFTILTLSIAIIAVSWFPVVRTLISFVLTKVIAITNAFVSWVAQWPFSTLDDISIHVHSVYLLYCIFICICLFFRYKRLSYLAIINLFMAFYTMDQIKLIITTSKKCNVLFYNNNALSFDLKHEVEQVTCSDLQLDNLDNKVDYMAFHNSSLITSWHGKIFFSIKDISPDWYIWDGPSLNVDYLLVEERLLEDIDVLLKICTFKKLIIYGSGSNQVQYVLRSNIKKLGIPYIWLQPDEKQEINWLIEENSVRL